MEIARKRFKENQLFIGFAAFLVAIFMGNYYQNRIDKKQYQILLKQLKRLYTISECKQLKQNIGSIAVQGIAKSSEHFIYLQSGLDKQKNMDQRISKSIKIYDENTNLFQEIVTNIKQFKIDQKALNFKKQYKFVRGPKKEDSFMKKVFWHIRNLFSQKKYKENLEGIKSDSYLLFQGEMEEQKELKVFQITQNPSYFYQQIQSNINTKRIKMLIDFLMSTTILALTLFNLFNVEEQKEQFLNSNLRRGQSLINNSQQCQICVSEIKNVLFLPCLHLATCLACYKKLEQQNDLCPFCRTKIQEYKLVEIDQINY